MKRITLVMILAFFAILQTANSQEIYKRVSINNINPNKIETLDRLGVDMTCGASVINNNMVIELSEIQLREISEKNIQYSVLIDDMKEFYSERAINNLPRAAAEIRMLKSQQNDDSDLTQRTLTINELINNVGQYDGCEEIDWKIPDNWNLNDADSYPERTTFFGGCLTYDQVLEELDDMKRLYPNLISRRKNASPTNQLTIEGRTQWMVRISDNPEVDEPEEPETLYQSLIHSREAVTVMAQLYYMWYLLENYDSDPAIRNLVNNHAMYFIPVFNPDGFVYNEQQAPNGGGFQRKNRNVGSNGCSTYANGIDLNRNSAYYWGNGGASLTNGCSDTFAGSGPFSENETQIMRDFVFEHDFKIALNHHSFKNAMLHAYAGTSIENPRPDEYSKYNHDMTFYNRYAHGPSTSISGLNSGNMNDWMLGGPAGVSAAGVPTGIGSGKNTLSWTPENGIGSESTIIGSGFWPDPVNYLPITRRAMRMNFLAAYYSGKYAKLHDLTQTDITSTSGNLIFGIENLGQNGNDPTPNTNNFTVTVTAITPNITINTASASQNFTASEILAQKEVDINYSLSGVSAGDEIQYKVTLTNDYASDNILYEAVITKIYQPTLLTTLDPTNIINWNSTGSWAAVTDGYNDNSAIRSNASATYAANQDRTLQYNGLIDLSNVESAVIQFYAKWDLERSFDYVQIEASANGSTGWTPLCGRLTKPSAPIANNTYSSTNDAGDSTIKTNSDLNQQNNVGDLYDGDTQDKWSLEEIVIDASTNSIFLGDASVFLRFQFKSDSSNRKDSYANADFEGFTFDDFKVIGLGCNTSTPSNVTASNISTDSATIDWDQVFNNSYDLRYRVDGTTTWTNITNFEGNTYNLSGLLPATTYQVRVRSKCGTSTNSAYSPIITFTTLACASPTNVTANDIGLSTVRVTWNHIPNATYDVRYRAVGSSTWINTDAGLILDQPVYNISGLNEATQYEVQVRTDCPGSGNSTYSTSTVFTTLGCAAPSNLNVPDVFIDSANIVWDALNPATYDLRYRVNGTLTWTVVSSISNNAFNISNLMPGTTYDVQVRTDCGSSNSSYSSTVNFTTLICTVPTNVTANDITSSSATINWDEINGSDYDLRYRQTGTATWTTVNDRTLNFYNIPNLLAITEYEVQVRTVCTASQNSAYSTSTVFTTSACDSTTNSFPYTESFESNFGIWEQSTNDDINWTRFSGLTPSNTGSNPPNTTGPNAASEGNIYIYVESSGNGAGFPNKQAILTSQCFDLSAVTSASFDFDYHMFSSAPTEMGSLVVQVSSDNFTTSSTVFTQTNSPAIQQTGNNDSWITESINLSSFLGQTIKVRLFATTGSSFRSDIAVDNIKLNANISSIMTWYEDSDNDGFGNPSVSQTSSTQPAGFVLDNTDCDDTDANEFPGQTWYIDADGDNYGT
ncbi:M14 family zinc carboxypeptidase, partial [Winogradskyella litorisediminis]